MEGQKSGFDWFILGTTIVIFGFGLLTILSIAPHLFLSQAVFGLFGFGLFFLFSRIDYRVYRRFAWVLFGLSFIFLMTTLLFGRLTRGSVRWLEIGGLTIQTSELVKPILILFFAWFFSSVKEVSLLKLGLGLSLLALPLFLILQQPDLGSSLIILFIWVGILFAAGVRLRWIFAGIILTLFSLPLFWTILKDYQRQRIEIFLNPFADPLKSGYHMLQSIVAAGSGQLFGRGLGHGPQSHLRFLPERHSDFIFASFSEELGFIGSFVLLALFAFLLLRILKVAEKADDRFGFFIGIGVFSLIFSQVFINIGMNLGILPITGITLPLISSGGSSLVAILISLGIIENVARFALKDRV